MWNLWWVNKAVTELHQLPWHTHLLHYPYGISLLLEKLAALTPTTTSHYTW